MPFFRLSNLWRLVKKYVFERTQPPPRNSNKRQLNSHNEIQCKLPGEGRWCCFSSKQNPADERSCFLPFLQPLRAKSFATRSNNSVKYEVGIFSESMQECYRNIFALRATSRDLLLWMHSYLILSLLEEFFSRKQKGIKIFLIKLHATLFTKWS